MRGMRTGTGVSRPNSGTRVLVANLSSGPFLPDSGVNALGTVSFDVLTGLTETLTLPQGAEFGAISPYVSEPTVYAATVALPEIPAEGILFEKGGTSVSSYVGLRDGGATLRLRVGNGGAVPNANTAVLDIPVSSLPSGANRWVWEFWGGTGISKQIKFWINNIYYGGVSIAGTGNHSGTGTGQFVTGTNSQVPTGEPSGDWPGSASGDLSLYTNQTVAEPVPVVTGPTNGAVTFTGIGSWDFSFNTDGDFPGFVEGQSQTEAYSISVTLGGEEYVLNRSVQVRRPYAAITTNGTPLQVNFGLNESPATIDMSSFFSGTVLSYSVDAAAALAGFSISSAGILTAPTGSEFSQGVIVTAQNDDSSANVTQPVTVVNGAVYTIFLLVGQSNMVGRPVFDGGATYPAGVLQLNQSGSVVAATTPLDQVDENPNSMGLALNFSINWAPANASRTLVLVPSARGASGFTDNQWNKGDPLYEAAVARANLAMSTYPGATFGGILWHQGERDVGNASFQSQLDQMISDMRADVTGASGSRFVLGSFSDGYVGVDASRIAMRNIVEDTPNRVSNTFVSAASDLTVFDGTHFDAASLRTLGDRYYTQLTGLTPGLIIEAISGGFRVTQNETLSTPTVTGGTGQFTVEAA